MQTVGNRPRGPKYKTTTLYVSVSHGLGDVIRERAAVEGLSVTALARRALMRELGVDGNGAPVAPGPTTLRFSSPS